MVYSALVSRLAAETGVDEEDVRRVLRTFPNVLMEGEEGEQSRTPLGVFTIVRRREKKVCTPDGIWSAAPERIQAKLKPGKRLQRLVDESSESSSSEAEEADSD